MPHRVAGRSWTWPRSAAMRRPDDSRQLPGLAGGTANEESWTARAPRAGGVRQTATTSNRCPHDRPRAPTRSQEPSPGCARAVTRLATLTGLPNQSPARLTASRRPRPPRSWGQPVGVRGVDEFKNRVDQPDGFGRYEHDRIPMVLMNHTGGSATSRASRRVFWPGRTRSSGGRHFAQAGGTPRDRRRRRRSGERRGACRPRVRWRSFAALRQCAEGAATQTLDQRAERRDGRLFQRFRRPQRIHARWRRAATVTPKAGGAQSPQYG